MGGLTRLYRKILAPIVAAAAAAFAAPGVTGSAKAETMTLPSGWDESCSAIPIFAHAFADRESRI